MNVDIDFLKGFMVGRAIGVKLAEMANFIQNSALLFQEKED